MSARLIGLLGGSFDPVHVGHVALAERALDQAGLDQVWLLPAQRNPLKENAPRATTAQRLRMVELAVEGRPGLGVCTWELDHAGPHRSVHTVRALRSANPGLDFRFLMGEDSFRELDGWAEPRELVRLAPPVVLPRPGSTGERPDSIWGVPVQWLEGEPFDLSSTALREALAAGRQPEGLDPGVLRFIREEGLYRHRS